jgi:glycosyltransferase involved in cell wall biosynthesis
MRTILVYRDDLLPRSEIEFMRRQYLAFSELRPLWVGRRARPWLDAAAFPTAGVWPGLAGLRFKLTGTVPDLPALSALTPALVHAQFGRGGALALPLARQLGVPLVVTFHGGDVHKAAHYRRFPLPALFRWRMRRLQQHGALFVCVSEAVRRRLVERGFPADKTTVVHIGTDRIDPVPRGDAGAGALFVGRFVEMKGLDVLVGAIGALRARGVTDRVTLIGHGPEHGRISRLLAGIPGIDLAGWQGPEQVRAAMRAARVVVIPSVVARSGEAEGLPSVAIEAMGLGTPVIASCEAGLAGVIAHGANGLLCRSRDPAALAACIAELLSAPGRALALGEAGRQTVVKDFDAAKQSRRLQCLLQRIIAESGRRGGG